MSILKIGRRQKNCFGKDKRRMGTCLPYCASLCVLFLFGFRTSAQNIQVNSYNGQSSITTYNGSITLGNGFNTQGNNVHIYITPTGTGGTAPSNPAVSPVATTLSNTMNYIAVWTATAPDTDPNHLMSRPLKDVKLAVQYLDGLGRPVQTIAKQGSVETSSGISKDIVLPAVYDNLGRESIQYLAYASSTNNGSYESNASASQSAFYGSTSTLAGQGENAANAMAHTVYDGSPLNRTTEAFAPGNSWAGTFGNPSAAGRASTKLGYYANTTTDAVRIWDITYPAAMGQWGSFSSTRTYNANTLYKNIVTDENGKQVIEFSDKQGKRILKKVQLTATADDGSGSGYTGWLCTYYVYDNFGQLKAIILPAAVKSMSANNTWTLSADMLNEQCFRYEYDAHGRVIMKKSPGAGEVHMLYDAKSRLVAMQDANMRDSSSRWLVTLYDNLDRPVETGFYNNATAFSALLTQVAAQTSFAPAIDELTETHYDSYDGLSATGLSANLATDWNAQFSATDNSNYPYPQMPAKSPDAYLQGAVTWTKTRVLYTNTYTVAVNIYDDQGRVIQTQSQNISGGVDVETTQYGWAGEPLVAVQKTQNKRTASSGTGEVLVAVSRMTYDDLGRVVKTEKRQSSTSVSSGTMTAFATTATMQYDELGHLKNKALGTIKDGGNNNTGIPLETQTIDYNIRGWLLGVNRAYVRDLGSTKTTTDDGSGEAFTEEGITAYSAGTNFFGFDLGYDKTDNQLINGQKYAASRLDGSITGMVWKNNADGAVRKYDFTYDAVNNLTAASFNQYTGTTFNKTAGYDFSVSNLTYDANGNMLTMNQTGKKADGSTGTIDQLSYTYQAFSGFTGNKLTKVNDAVNTSTDQLGDFQNGTNTDDDYAYDDNGNLTTDKNKNIQNINYNFLNLPQKITAANATIEYIYDAGGAELQKKVTTTTTVTTTTYIGAAVYQQSSLNGAAVVDTLQFFGMEEGRVRVTSDKRFVYDYFLADHLGNTRMIITDDYNAPSPILEADNYYPFGLKMAAISYSYGTHVKNPYQYGSGSEFNDVTGWNEFALRDYDPQIGRFVQQDPFDQFASGYVGNGNDPINNADPSGGFSLPGALIGTGTGFIVGMMYGGATTGNGNDMLKDGLIGAGMGAAIGGFAKNIHFGEVGKSVAKVASNPAASIVNNAVRTVVDLSVASFASNSPATYLTPTVLSGGPGVAVTPYTPRSVFSSSGLSVYSNGILSMTVTSIKGDADGSLGAYNIDSKKGLDNNLNARYSHYNKRTQKTEYGGFSENVVTFENGAPKIFTNGNLLAMSSLHLKTRSDIANPNNYLDSRTYPYFVLTGEFAKANGIRIGDIAMIEDLDNGFKFFSIYGDSGPNIFTEGSINLQQRLGHPEIQDARHTITGRFKFTIFKHSGRGQARYISPDQIQKIGAVLEAKYLKN